MSQFATRIATSMVIAQFTPNRGGLVAMKSRISLRNSRLYRPRSPGSVEAANASCGRCCIRASSHGTFTSAPRTVPYLIFCDGVSSDQR